MDALGQVFRVMAEMTAPHLWWQADGVWLQQQLTGCLAKMTNLRLHRLSLTRIVHLYNIVVGPYGTQFNFGVGRGETAT